MHRVEPGGVEYNYASASKGAKVLAFNKEAKGTSNILGKDMDKYLRNPCSAEGKFVIIELSEETLVSMIEIANFEHYSSNLKDFEVLGSLVYPTENWVKLGHFSAKNIKQFQKFRLEEPKWVTYLRLDFLSHYGSEFYCTLSTVKVYGIDAVEHMLEDLISKQDNISPPEEPFHNADGIHQDSAAEGYFEPLSEDASTRNDDQNNGDDQTRGLQSQGKVAGDSALKILMQKVRSLDLNLSVLERYIDELNSRYGNMLKELDGEMAEKTIMLKTIRSEMRNFLDDQENIVKEISDLVSWKSLVSSKIDALKKENTILRSEIERVTEFQMHFDNKIVIVLLVTFSIGFLSTIKLALGFSVNMFTGEEKYREFCRSQASWILLWLNCATVGLVILL